MDSFQHDAPGSDEPAREDLGERLRQADAAHDHWFRQQVAQALAEADDPAADWVTNDTAEAAWAEQRARRLTQAGGDAV